MFKKLNIFFLGNKKLYCRYNKPYLCQLATLHKSEKKTRYCCWVGYCNVSISSSPSNTLPTSSPRLASCEQWMIRNESNERNRDTVPALDYLAADTSFQWESRSAEGVVLENSVCRFLFCLGNPRAFSESKAARGRVSYKVACETFILAQWDWSFF